jgi:hypothetical protein
MRIAIAVRRVTAARRWQRSLVARPCWLGSLAALLCLLGGPARATAVPPAYRIAATLSRTPPQVRGTVDTDVENTTAEPLRAIVVVLFPNRFAVPDEGINDANRPYVYPREEFDPGGMTVGDVRVDGQPVSARPTNMPGIPDGCLLTLDLPVPLQPGQRGRVQLAFTTTVPYRFGAFGEFDDMLTAVGGWYPYVPALRTDGVWEADALPPRGDFEVQLAADPGLEVLLGGQHFPRSSSAITTRVQDVHYLTLMAAPVFLRETIDADGMRIVWFRRPPVRSDRRAPGPSQVEITRDALRTVVAQRPAAVPMRGELVVVEAPLRLNLTAPGEGVVVVSDRILKVLWVLRPFHEAQLAQAVYAELSRPRVAARESPRDYTWVSEGLSHQQAIDYLARANPDTRSVQDWIELFNVFAIVDRFETAPKIPFVGAFFERARTPDPLHEQISTFNNDLPPGHVIFGKLQRQVGDADYRAVFDRCVDASLPFRACAAQASEQDLAPFFAQWLQPYPEINYDFAAVELNQPQGSAYRQAVTVRRSASREIHEPVDVQLRSIGGQPVRVRWDGSGDDGHLIVETPQRMVQALIDPDRKLIETTRADDASPPTPQVVLDRAEVEISSTEFGFAALVVARPRYDYRKDLAVAGVYTNRGVGVDAGPRIHWGTPNDPTLYRNNLFGFYSLQALDGSFKDNRHPTLRTRGHVNGLGARYDYNNLYAFDNPSRSVDLRLHADWFDSGLGSDFNYVDWGASVVLTHPLWTPRTILAGEVTNSFSEPLGSSRVPNQGLYSLGGSRSIRGIGAEDELGRNIFTGRTELRQTLYPELDLNFLDLLVLRRTQVRLFVDTGQVDNSAGAVYDPTHYAVGAGTGFALMYDFMGFFPSVAYIEVATRLDQRQSDVQFLFGTRQAF